MRPTEIYFDLTYVDMVASPENRSRQMVPEYKNSLTNTTEVLWPTKPRQVLEWLLYGIGNQSLIETVFAEMCKRLAASDVPVARGTLFFDTHNPQWLGTRILWEQGMTEADVATFDYDVEVDPDYLTSPVFDVSNGASEVRQWLVSSFHRPAYPIYEELANDGFTDYVAWPLQHSLGQRHVVTFATKSPSGFSPSALAYLKDVVPVLALISEIRVKNRLMTTYLDTYVGPAASKQIRAGLTTRGSGFTVQAAVLISDLRDFTSISDVWATDDVLNFLNSYFDAMADPIERHGGEILKFMGDGLLAIFKLSDPMAATNLLHAIWEAQSAMAVLNAKHAENGHPQLAFGMGVHVGDVIYGNIGTKSRLDFTAIGPAVNIASRLENLTKLANRPILLSKMFAQMAGCMEHLESLGPQHLRGLVEPVEVFAMPADFSATWKTTT